MFDYLFLKLVVFNIIFIIYLSIVCHTVANTSDAASSQQNDSTNRITLDQSKREGKKQLKLETLNPSRTANISDEKVVVPESSNITVHNKPIFVEDQFNSTAGLPPWMLNIKEGALQRTGYVALGFMSIILIFFVVRAVRLRQKRSKSRKYGIITSNVSDMEMEPLDKDDDEEEDATLFDAQHKYSLQ